MRRIFRTGLLLATCMTAPIGAQAGFEFVAPPQKAQSSQNNPQPLVPDDGQMMQDGTMPTAPMAEVTAEPLAAPSINQGMYAQTQRDTVRLMPSANEAIDTRGLLAATSQGRPVSIAPQGYEQQPSPRPATVSASGSDRLVINPYPLRGRSSVSSNPSDMALAGAMMQPAALPSSGQQAGASSSGLSLMPMPGGEGAPITSTGRVSSYAPAAPAAPQAAPVVSRAVPRGPDDTAMQTYSAPAQNGNFGEAVGFGRDLPLALAMSQIVPAQYTYSFDGSVDKGATVSWQGGKPWNVVLNEMLASSGMRAVINNNQVTIVKAG